MARFPKVRLSRAWVCATTLAIAPRLQADVAPPPEVQLGLGLASFAGLGGLVAALALLGWYVARLVRRHGDKPVKARAVLDAVGLLCASLVLVALASFLLFSRGRRPTEPAAIGDARAMISCQQAYADANQGLYDIPECLSNPHRCLPSYPSGAPAFIDPPLGRSEAVKGGYRRTFHQGPAPQSIPPDASSTSITAYAYVLTPEPGTLGVRSFCADSSGALRFTAGPPGRVANGSCDERTWPGILK